MTYRKIVLMLIAALVIVGGRKGCRHQKETRVHQHQPASQWAWRVQHLHPV